MALLKQTCSRCEKDYWYREGKDPWFECPFCKFEADALEIVELEESHRKESEFNSLFDHFVAENIVVVKEAIRRNRYLLERHD